MRRLALFLCAVAAVATLAVGSGGFSSAEAGRGVTVGVVGDGNAYLALEHDDETVERDGMVDESLDLEVVTVTNQFTEDVTVTVDYDVATPPGVSATDGSDTTELGVGETTQVSTTVTCDRAGEHGVTVEFDASATGGGVSTETSDPRTVSYTVRCEPGTTTTVTGEAFYRVAT